MQTQEDPPLHNQNLVTMNNDHSTVTQINLSSNKKSEKITQTNHLRTYTYMTLQNGQKTCKPHACFIRTQLINSFRYNHTTYKYANRKMLNPNIHTRCLRLLFEHDEADEYPKHRDEGERGSAEESHANAMPVLEAARDPERSRGRRRAHDHTGHKDAVIHEDDRVAVVGEDAFGSSPVEEEREGRHRLEDADGEHRRRHHRRAAEGGGGGVHDPRERGFGVHGSILYVLASS